MGSVSSEDGSDELCGSYSLSADVSESESSSSFSCRRLDAGGSSSSIPSSPLGNGNFTFPATAQQHLLTFPVVREKGFVVWEKKPEKREVDLSEYSMMKERFAKLLLGEDMSGGAQGVCSALAISNAITNLSATVFGELWRLEPLASQKKTMWCREMEWMLCVSDSIVEFVPSKQQFLGGGKYEVMATRPRSDLYMNLPALKKIDAMLISMLDEFQETEFWYVDGGIIVPDAEMYPSATSFCGRPSVRQEEKWWLPCPKVPPTGLSEDARKRLQQCRDCTNQILKASMAINSSVLAEMEIPNAYLETLPKSEKACLGDDIYHYTTAEQFFPERILGFLDLSSEYRALDVANRIEAAIHVGKQKDQRKPKKHLKAKHSSWGGKVKCLVADGDKKLILAQRAMTLLHSLRLRFPSLPQTALDMSKIQYNKDVGQSILESYSRVMESLAFNVMARIDDVLYVDDITKQCVAAESQSLFSRGGFDGLPIQKRMTRSPFSIQHTPYTSPLATPIFCFSPPQCQSPGKTLQHSDKNGLKGHPSKKFHIPMPADLDKLWSYAGNLSSRNAPERD